MTWTSTNLILQVVAGILGGHAAAGVTRDYGFGALGHTISGALGGGLSGYFLQTLIGTFVTGAGSSTEPTAVDQALIQGLTGAVAGAIVTLGIGFVKHSLPHK
jgi:cation transporter-like permease